MSELPKARRSIRTIILSWLFLFSIVPLAFVTGYSVLKFKDAITKNLNQKLMESFLKLETEIEEYEKALDSRSAKYIVDPSLIYGLSTNSNEAIQNLALSWMRGELATRLTIFDRDARPLVSVTSGSTLKTIQTQDLSSVVPEEDLINRIKEKNQSRFIRFTEKESPRAFLVVFTKVTSRSGRLVGYVEQSLDIDEILEPLKKLLNLEIFLADKEGKIFAASDVDLKRMAASSLDEEFNQSDPNFFELPFKGEPLEVMLNVTQIGETSLNLGIAISKRDMAAVLQNVNMAFLAVVGAIVALLAVTALVTTNWLMRPLDRLLLAVRSFKESGVPVTVPVTTATEVGLLSESFNEMALAVHRSKSELESKIEELEKANSDLKIAQAKLVHSAKMASVGQLVAGVAHELNNPIGFIYSNMTHLREYSEKLMQFARKVSEQPEKLSVLKDEFEFDFIEEDMPKLINSCEDGAKRTRDIVIGLRNFSRLEEAKLKKVNINSAIENTLSLLRGELKTRIRVEKDFQDLPEVECYASQINQVFMNILTNAAQAIDGEGVISIRTRTAGENVDIYIRDSGKGIPSDLIERVFDPFFTTKSVGEGTGLGLSISYGIIDKHGGSISIDSASGEGTEFKISLPVGGPNGASS